MFISTAMIGSLARQCRRVSVFGPCLYPITSNPVLLRTCRTLILDSATKFASVSQLSESDEGILEMKLERAKRKNAISRDMINALRECFDVIDKDLSAKVLVITSSIPNVFCAGADLKERITMSSSEVGLFAKSLRSTMSMLEELKIPTIAAIEGAALGGGLELALACDIRICGEDAVLGMPETGLAIIPGAGGTQRLPRLVGKSVAKELIFTGRMVQGREALSIGLVNFCVPVGEARAAAIRTARDMNQKGPLGIRMAKRAIDGGYGLDMQSALAVEEECYARLLSTEDRLEGLAAFSEKRKPKYKGD